MNQYTKQQSDFVNEMLQKSLGFIGDEDMEKIQGVTIAQAGFGGVGALILELLARWGIKSFRLLDMDKYELSNMNRQIFAVNTTLGRYKAEVAGQRIKEINPYAEIQMVKTELLTKDNCVEFIKGADVIINGIDFPSGQIPLHYYAKQLKIPVVNPHCMNTTGAAIEVFDYRKDSQQSIDEPTKSPFINSLAHRYLKLFKFDENSLSDESLIKADNRFRGKQGATLNFVTNLAACIAVCETIKLITGKGKLALYPKQILIDPYNLKFRIRSVYSVDRYWNYVKERILGKDTRHKTQEHTKLGKS